MNRKNIFLWTLYDFANSIVVVVFFLYFSQWLVVEHGVSDLWYNLIFVGSTVLLIITAPIYGIIADKTGRRLFFLRVTTIWMFVFLLAASLIADFSPQLFFWAGLAFMVGNYFYQFSFSFYNPMLHDIARPSLQGFVSGLGQMANWLGQIAGLLVTLPLAAGTIYLVGTHGRAQTFLPATILFFILSLPMLFVFKDPVGSRKADVNIRQEYKKFFHSFRELIRLPGIGRFLLAYFFFNDAIITVINNFPIYLDRVFGVSDRTKSLVLVAILITSALGALISGWVSDKIGLKKTLIIILFGWVIAFPLMASQRNFTYFAVIGILMGFLFGAVWTVARAVMSYLSPDTQLNYSFSFYTLAERFSTFIGPLGWGLTILLLSHLGTVRYHVAMMLMGVFVFVGLLIVRKIPGHSSGEGEVH